MIYIGIDPGKKGAICAQYQDGRVLIKPFPLIGTELDHKQIFLDFCEIVGLGDNDDIKAVLEDVHGMFGVSTKSTFSFGHTKGFLEGLLCSFSIPYTLVPPKKWQKEMWQGISVGADPKANSIASAKRLFPKVSLVRTPRSKKDDDNIADALLMMEYCKRKL